MAEATSNGSEDPPEARSTRWLAHGFEALVASLEGNPERGPAAIDFDVVIVGSGYGGAVAAAELAGARGDRRVCVLERGNEHLPGSFPSRMSELPGHVRFSTQEARHARGRRDGLFDVRIGEDLCAVVGNGLGGGSLINAGVMAMPDRAVFGSARWPAAFREAATVDALLDSAGALRRRLGATRTVQSVRDPAPIKFHALGRFHGGARVDALPITVALADRDEEGLRTEAGVRIDACVRCGDCATGCNHNAKVSLDATLLAQARQHGAELFTGATVLKLEKQWDGSGAPVWHLHVVHTDEPLRRRQGKATVIRARRVVLAAGTFGSTEILLRSRKAGLRLSHTLGHRVSANGDLIAAAYGGREDANCAGNEDVDPTQVPAHDRVGPTITGMLDLRATDDMLIQDLAVPGPLRTLMEQGVTTASAIHLLAEPDEDPHGPDTHDACAVDQEAIRRTLMVAIIGPDNADGVMKLNDGDGPDGGDGDGATSVRWPALRDDPRLEARHRRFEELLRGSGARALPNPMWQLMPRKLQDLLGGDTGPLLTVHPLGGCPMGDDAASGVVDDCGRVFDAAPGDPAARHEGLVVLDGSIIPTSLGINPALTIAGVALRAIGQLRTEWGYTADAMEPEAIGDRPRFRTPGPVEPARDTQIEVLERLSGAVPLRGIGGAGPLAAHVELTLRFDPIAIRDLTSGGPAATLQLQAAHGCLRIFPVRPADDTEAPDHEALLIATVKGRLRTFAHRPSSSAARRFQGLWAWFRNRGLRDTVLWLVDRWKGQASAPTNERTFAQEASARLKSLWALSSRAGGARLFEYELEVENVRASRLPAYMQKSFAGAPIRAVKELTYSRRSNPWRQMSRVKLTAFPRARTHDAVLELDTGYLARQKVPLLRIVRQQDHAKALVDVAALGLYLARVLVHLHAWSFRLPDEPPPRDIQRLPGYVPGLPPPQVHEFPVAGLRDGRPVMVRLTHYPFSAARRSRALAANPRAREALATPILLIHGYSASGTTFAHHSVRPNVASSLWGRGRDVWIADLRTSAGMPHAREPWTFEQVGMADIPVAVHQVCAMTGAAKIDVFAHCMGSAMLGMALLGSESPRERFLPLRRELPDRIRRLVMSQVAPAVVFTPDNTFRAYAMQYLRHFLPLEDYEFRPSGPRSHKDRLVDRLLATLPYPEEEFDRENPFWPPWRRTPWVGTRHRMDALYGRDFNVNNLPREMLDCIDDHFGPLSIETVSQAVHFARLRAITTRQGFNDFVRPDRLRGKLRFPILHVHGRQNGLVSNRTPAHYRKVLTDSDARFESPQAFQPILYDAGHQDLLIGRPAAAMFEDMNRYLEAPFAPVQEQPGGIRITFAARIPAHGVRLPPPFDGHERCSLGDEGANGAPVAALLIPVARHGERYLPVDDEGHPMEPTVQALAGRVDWRALTPVSPNELATRYTFELDGRALPAGADGLLVLVLYNQSAALQPGVARCDSELAMRVASRSPGGRGLAGLAGMAADPDSIALAGADGAKDLTDRIVKAMAQAVRRAFERAPVVELGLGILRPPPRRDPSASPVRCFALASCQYPGDILDRTPPGTPERSAPAGPSDASYLRLLDLLEGRRGAGGNDGPAAAVPQFLVLAGDQIYADATAGLFDPRRLDDRFRLSYEAFFGARGPRAVLSRLPAVMRADDHEIADNFEPGPPGAGGAGTSDRLVRIGVREFLRNQCDEDMPGPVRPRLWHATPVHGLPFFWADARTLRTPRTAATVGSASMLGDAQADALDRWLADKGTPGPRFFVSAPMVLPRHLATRAAGTAAGAIRSDAWDGFPASLHRLLAQVHARGRDDVFFLSGDAHVSNVCRIEIRKAGEPGVVVAHSVHSSALYAPYPFANGIEEDFAGEETFGFEHGGADYECKVRTSFPARGDGFAVLTVSQEPAGWRVDVRFDREQDPPPGWSNGFHLRFDETEAAAPPAQAVPA